MANELSLTVTLSYTPSDANQVAIAPASFTKTVSLGGGNYDHISGTQAIATSDTALNVGDLASIGYILIKNLDDTNFVEFNKIGTPAGAEYTMRLNAGEFCLFRLGQGANPTVLNCLANSSAVDIQYWAFEA
jgi:hypothetical protein